MGDATKPSPGADAPARTDGELRRRLAELRENQGWVHHVADLRSGKVETVPLDRPLAPLSRAERLARVGFDVGDISIFGGPSYRLTPRRPYQPSPEAHLIASFPDAFSADDDAITWQPPPDGGGTIAPRGMRFSFDRSPDQRSLFSVALSGYAWPGTTGFVRLTGYQGAAVVRFPISDTFAAHTLDVSFSPLGDRASELLMFLEPGIRMLTFSAIAFAANPPVLEPVA
jgi:hypothetical protein